MAISEVRAQYRDADSLLFHTVIKRIWEQKVGEKWVVRKIEIVYGDSDPVQPIEYSDGWIIPPEWEFMSQKWTYKRKLVDEVTDNHNNEIMTMR